MKKSEIIRIRSTEVLKNKAEARAEKIGVSLSAYITMLIKKDCENEK